MKKVSTILLFVQDPHSEHCKAVIWLELVKYVKRADSDFGICFFLLF